MAESDSSKPATAVLIVMVGLWVALLITMRAGINIPSPIATTPSDHAAAAVEGHTDSVESTASPSGDDEVSGDEYEVLQQVLSEFPQLTTVFEAAMVDGKMTYQEAENILERKEALEAEAQATKQKQARERLQNTIEKLRNQ